MDSLTFIAEIVKALAWPVAVCVLVFALRVQLAAVFKRLASVKHNDTEVRFSEEVDRAKEALDTKSATQASPGPAKPISDVESRILKLIEVSPSAGLVEAWTLLEGALRKKARELGLQPEQRGPVPLQRVLSTVRDAKKIDDEDMKLVLQMREWRNWSVHSSEREYVDAATAWKFASMALQLMRELEE